MELKYNKDEKISPKKNAAVQNTTKTRLLDLKTTIQPSKTLAYMLRSGWPNMMTIGPLNLRETAIFCSWVQSDENVSFSLFLCAL